MISPQFVLRVRSFTENLTVSHNPDSTVKCVMTPVERGRDLIADNPDKAESLLCFLVWATSSRDDPVHEAELEEVEEFLYSKTEHSRVNREAHRRLLERHLRGERPAISTVP